MKTIFSSIITWLLCCSLSIYGQANQIKVQKSEINKDKKKHSTLMYTASDGVGGVILLRQFLGGLTKSPKGYYLEYFDKNLNLIGSKEMEIDDSSIKNVFIKEGKIHVIEYRRNRENNTNDYNVLSANLNDLNFTSKHLFSIDRKDVKKPFFFAIGLIPITNSGQIDHDPTGEVILSENNKFAVFNFDVKDDGKETQRVIVYNDNLEQVFDKTFSEEVKDKYFQYNSITVSDEDGSVYFLGKAYKNNSFKDKVKGEINYAYKLYKVNAEGVQSNTFETQNNYINSLGIMLNEKGVFCIGAYSEKNSDDFKGVAYFKVNPSSLTIEDSKLNPFPEQFMIDKYGEKKGKRKKSKNKELPFLTYKDFIITNQGDIYFNAEEFFITTHTSMNANGGMTTRTVYHYNDIYTCKLNTEGELQWIRTINKKQSTSGNLDYLSFSSAVANGKMYIFLNGADSVKKLRDDRIQFKQERTKKMNLYVIEVKPDGSFNYEILISDDDSKMTYKTKYGVRFNDLNTIIFEGNKDKNKQILKLTI
ncbi:MAG: hypothetical protein GYB39_07795 [Algicola sp.]|nr:hypothetical protein [Algicola sp.]